MIIGYCKLSKGHYIARLFIFNIYNCNLLQTAVVYSFSSFFSCQNCQEREKRNAQNSNNPPSHWNPRNSARRALIKSCVSTATEEEFPLRPVTASAEMRN